MKPVIRLSIFSLVILAMLFAVPIASAHPLGNFTINHFDGIHIAADKVWVDYVLDMAEIPAFQEISLMDKTPDGKPDPAGLPPYAARQCQAIDADLALQINGSPVTLTLAQSGVSFPPGAAGLSTLRLTCTYQNTTVKVASTDRIAYTDGSYSDRIGWREIVVTPEGIPLQGDFTTASVSKELTSYPTDMLSSPLDVRQVSLSVGTGPASSQAAPGGSAASQQTAAWSAGARSDRFTELITLQVLTPTSILIALLIAFVWGGLHSLTPGHGKTIAGAYLVGNRGTARHAVYLGLMTTVTHTAGVFLLGLVTLVASRFILPDQLFPWISVLSGLLVVVIGITLAVGRLRTTQTWASLVRWLRHPFKPGQDIQAEKRTVQFYPVALAGLAGIPPEIQQKAGLTGYYRHADGSMHSHDALLSHGEHLHVDLHSATEIHMHADGTVQSHSHLHDREHSHADLDLAHEHEHFHGHLTGDHSHAHPAGDHAHTDPDSGHEHQHLHLHPGEGHSHDLLSPHEHSHLPPGADGSKVSLRSLLALGISGGLLPCPSALVVMLGAIALNRIAFGVVLVLVFSLGLASVLTGIGLALVYTRRYFDRIPLHSRFIELIPAGSAVFITILGIGITLQSLVQLGWIGH